MGFTVGTVGADGILAINAKSQRGQRAPPALLAYLWDPSCHQKPVLKKEVMFPFRVSHFLQEAGTKLFAPCLSLCAGSFGAIMLCSG